MIVRSEISHQLRGLQDGTSKLRLKFKFKIIYSVLRLALSICNNVAVQFVLIGSR